MFIDGFGISNYRSFGNDLQLIGPCNRINLFIGQNNSGKSNVLRFLNEHFKRALEITSESRGGGLKFNNLDQHQGGEKTKSQLAFGLKRNGDRFKSIIEKRNISPQDHVVTLMDYFLQFPEMLRGTEIAWFVYDNKDDKGYKLSDSNFKGLMKISPGSSSKKGLTSLDWRSILKKLKNSLPNIEVSWKQIPDILNAISPNQLEIPEISVIKAIREIKNVGSSTKFDYNGLNIVQELARLDRPDPGEKYPGSKERFKTINQFIRDVVGKPDARLEIPVSKNTILVEMDGKTLPLENLGTGIHEVIIIACAATLLENQIICIEEPEIHLHPLLQKKLLRYLDQNTSNQYFITTHSASMIDIPNASIFHVTHDGTQSKITYVTSNNERFSICTDLGYRASDLLQSNCIIWVEGPSDRIYLNHWLSVYNSESKSELKEGIHYSIMFYGGRLLNHLTVNDEEIDEFISLKKINQNIAIIIDSDRVNESQEVNETKQRIRDEFGNGPGFAWITTGREIENYILTEILEKAVKSVYPGAKKLESPGQYSHCCHFIDKEGQPHRGKDIDKVKIAKAVVPDKACLDVLDLRDRIGDIVRFIRISNGLQIV